MTVSFPNYCTDLFRIEGWIHLWELDQLTASEAFCDGSSPKPCWEPFFLVLYQNISALETFQCEEASRDDPEFNGLKVMRLDGGKESFEKRWGYHTIKAIKRSNEKLMINVSSESLTVPSCKNGHLPVFHRDHPLKDPSSERRGSVPLMSLPLTLAASRHDVDNLDAVSTGSHKLSNFFSMKSIKSNLKRTKSATKLDRKRSAPLTQDQEASVISTRLRAARSHDSLLTSKPAMRSIDLNAKDVVIKPLHSSILGQEHCFQVSSSHGSKYVSCQSAEERDKWIENLRKTIHPNQEQSQRIENSLSLWIVEAKNVPSKKRYFCEICLDKTLYARTSSKLKSEMLFWGEQFEFSNLPSVNTLTINIYREADNKRKKRDRNILIGYVNIPACDINKRLLSEKWYTSSSGTVGRAGRENRAECALLRAKARYQTVHILPMEVYKDFVNFLTLDYCTLCESLETVLNVRDKEDIASSLVHTMQQLGKACQFLTDIIMLEVENLDNERLVFRGNTIATKAIESYMKLVGERYLHDTLGEFVRSIMDDPDDCEVDPNKVIANMILNQNRTNLRMYCEMAWVKIVNSYIYFPRELVDIFASITERCNSIGKPDLSNHIISASIFLRFLCPAILSPSLFGLSKEYPQEKSARNLTLIAKTIQTLANFTDFGGGKEEFMTFMNSFVHQEASSIKGFLTKISSDRNNDGSGDHLLRFDGYIDLGKQLSLLHGFFSETLDKSSDQKSLQSLDKLRGILSAISQRDRYKTVFNRRSVVRSQVYDNVNNNETGYHNRIDNQSFQNKSSPTEILRDMLRVCGEDLSIPQTVPSVVPQQIAPQSMAPTMSSKRKASNNLPKLMIPDNHSSTEILNDNRDRASPSCKQTPVNNRNWNGEMSDYGTLNSSIKYDASSPSSFNSQFSYLNKEKLVSDVSVRARVTPNTPTSEKRINHNWNQIVNAATLADTGDHMGLIEFMDDIGESENIMPIISHGNELSGSELSIGQLSNIASSGYQSYGYSQTSSPVESSNDLTPPETHVPKSPTTSFTKLQPLSFSNPAFGETPPKISTSSPVHDERVRRISTNSNENNANLCSHQNFPCKPPVPRSTADSGRNSIHPIFDSSYNSNCLESQGHTTAQLAHPVANTTIYTRNRSSASYSMTPTPYCSHSFDPRKKPEAPIALRYQQHQFSRSGTITPNSTHKTNGHSLSPVTPSTNSNLFPRNSYNFSSQKFRPSSVSTNKQSSPLCISTSPSYHVPLSGRRSSSGSMPSSPSYPRVRRASHGAIHLGLSSVQHRSNADSFQDDNEPLILRKKLTDTQQRFDDASSWLRSHPSITESSAEESQNDDLKRIEEKSNHDRQMQEILTRLKVLEEELSTEKLSMQQRIQDREDVIQEQEKKISSLDSKNSKLLNALNELMEQYNTNMHNNSVIPDLPHFKTSLC